ncbi:MAG: type II secretion system F family protein [Actinomycetota bacterium]
MIAGLAPILFGVAAGCAVLALVLRRGAARLVEDVPTRSGGSATALGSSLERIGSIGWVGSLGARSLRSKVASMPGPHPSYERVLGSKVLAAMGGGLLAVCSPWPLPLLAAFFAAAGWRLPDAMLAARVRRYRRQVDAEVPQLLDLLAAGSVAGLPAPAALEQAVGALQGPLSSELVRSIRQIDLGVRWRDELGATARRLDLPDLSRAVTTLTRTDALGVSLAEAVGRLSAQVRGARRAAASERARKAPVKMLFPLVFLILPAFLLLTVVPVLISTVRSI